MNGWPHSPTNQHAKFGIHAIPKFPANPYDTVRPGAEGEFAFFRDGAALYLVLYDRELEPSPPGPTNVGWHITRMATSKQALMFSYDFATLGGAIGTIALTAHDGPLPDDFIVQNAFIDVITPLASGGAATGALTTGQGVGDLVAATVVAGAPWSTTGQKITIPLLGTIATWVKTTDDRDPALVVAVAALTAGAFNVFIEGYVSA